MKSAVLLSEVRFSPRSTKNTSCADSSILCAFWQHYEYKAFKDGKVLAEKGFGRNVRE
jgi:hypothetical protein